MKYLFLDLESTVIGHWTNFTVLEHNMARVHEIIKTHGIDYVGIYSYAIHNLTNLNFFLNHDFHKRLQRELGDKYKNELVITTDEMCRRFAENTPYKNQIDTGALWTIICKEVAFNQFADAMREPLDVTEFHLLDDTVRDMEVAVARADASYKVVYHYANPTVYIPETEVWT